MATTSKWVAKSNELEEKEISLGETSPRLPPKWEETTRKSKNFKPRAPTAAHKQKGGQQPSDKKKRNRFPAIKSVKCPETKNDLFQEVSYYIPHSMYFDEPKIAVLNKYHPSTLEQFHRYNCYNLHPLCASFRSIGEAHIITRIQQECRDNGIVDGFICDVGGSVNRHHSLGRNYIHSCVPNFEAKDLLRQFSLKGNNYCRQLWKDCKCKGFVASMSIHSLYYLEPEEILRNLLEQELPIHYALLHLYPEDSGEIMHGEMRYVKQEGRVSVWASGNSTPYYHGDMAWLSKGSYSDQRGTLVWERERTFEDVYVYRFVATTAILKPTPEIETLVDDAPYLEVCKEAFRGHLEINEKNRTSYYSRCHRYAKGRGLDPQRLIKVADGYYMSQPTLVSRPSVGLLLTKKAREAGLQMVPEYIPYLQLGLFMAIYLAVWRFVPSSHMVDYIMLAFVLLQPFILRTGWLNGDDRWRNIFIINTIFCLFSASFFQKITFDVILQLPKNVKLAIYAISFMATMYKNARKLRLNHLGARLYDYCCEGMALRAISKRKTIKYRTRKHKDCQPGLRAYPFVFHRQFVPMIPRRCDHNIHACIQHKILAETPEDVDFDIPIPDMFKRMAPWVRYELEPLDFETWVNRFPASKREKLKAEWAESKDDPIDNDLTKTSLFTKAEFYPEKKPPRPIGSAGVKLNFLVGRWLVPLGALIQKFCPDNICIPIHSDSVSIGRFAGRYMNTLKCICDFSQFDSTQREEALKLIVDVFRLLGVPDEVCSYMLRDCELINITNRKGFRLKCRGVRVSGRSETLLGNCILTICIFMHVFKGFIAMLGKGDDVVLFLPRSMRALLPALVAKVESYGFITKFRVCDEYDLEFCSSYFVPTNLGYVLTPKPGRVLAKTLWCKNTNFNQKEQLQQFAGILKGIKENFGFLPYINALYTNPYYLANSGVDRIRHEYNEYTDENVVSTPETAEWLMVKYDLGEEELQELEAELSSGFPIELKSQASYRMIEEDWGPPNDSSLLQINETKANEYVHTIACAFIEECARGLHPLLISLFLGAYESYHNRTLYNLLAHILLGLVFVEGGFFLAFMLHMFHNLVLVARAPILSIVKTKTKQKLKNTKNKQKFTFPQKFLKFVNMNKSKKKLLNEIASLKGQVKSQRRKTSKNKRPEQVSMRQVANMIRDPCNAELQPGFHSTDEGVLSRLKTRHSMLGTNTCGFVLWAPAYASVDDPSGGPSNFFIFTRANSSDHPTNSGAAPFGSGASTIDGQGTTLEAGASPFCKSAIVADQRSVGACMRLLYFGRMDSAAGQVAIIENLPAEALIDDGTGVVSNVDQLFNRASRVMRMGTSTFEVKYRPGTASALFKTERDGVITVGNGVASTLTSESLRFGPKLMGFAWKDVSAVSDLSIECFQNIEWRPNTDSGFVSVIPRQLSSPGMTERVLLYLDRYYPGWETNVLTSTARLVSQMAFTGTSVRGPRRIVL